MVVCTCTWSLDSLTPFQTSLHWNFLLKRVSPPKHFCKHQLTKERKFASCYFYINHCRRGRFETPTLFVEKFFQFHAKLGQTWAIDSLESLLTPPSPFKKYLNNKYIAWSGLKSHLIIFLLPFMLGVVIDCWTLC